MKIVTINIKLNKTDKDFIEKELSQYAYKVLIDYDSKSKKYKASTKLNINDKEYHCENLNVIDNNYLVAIDKLKVKLANSYSKYNIYRIEKKRRAFKEYKKNLVFEERSIIEDEDDLFFDYPQIIE